MSGITALLNRLAQACIIVFIAGWLMAWFVRPLPSWFIPAMVASLVTAFASLALSWLITGFSAGERPYNDEGYWSSPAENDFGSQVLGAMRARTYRISGAELIYLFVFATGWFAVVMYEALRDLPERWTLGEFLSAVLVVLFALLPAAITATVPYEVFISGEGDCRFRSLFNTQAVRAQQIRSIEFDEGDIELHHDGGKVRIRRLQDFEDFLGQLIVFNPALELPRGWREEIAKR